ncbi:MAG TPA: protein translocase subunit SecF [Anaeromyxobacteraceae bacterium]|nr:protein translocase subunit SecF [Anaeromyxobacteraceae bacterium]
MKFKTFDILPHGTKFDFVGKRNIAVTLSLIANLAVIIWCLPAVHGLNYGVDFAGGTEMEVKFSKPVSPGDIRTGVEALGFTDASVQQYGNPEDNTFLIRVGRIALTTQDEVNKVAAAVKSRFPSAGDAHFNPEVGDKIDFEFKGAPPTPEELRAAVESAGVQVREVREEQGLGAGTRAFAVITQGIQDKIERDLSARFQDASPDVRRVEYVGPAVGRELRNQGFKAVLYAMGLIVLYIGFRFDFRFSPGVIIALLHDAILALGYFAFTGREFNLVSVAVILTIVGYSVNDTVVIYDRIRENQAKYKGRKLSDIVNQAINEVLGRTFLTSVTTALSLIGLLFFGVGSLFDFAAALLVGIITGTYSTWFIAAPMTVWLEERAEKRKKREVQAAAVAR